MKKRIKSVKKMFDYAMKQLCETPDLCAKKPDKDFTRNRKLPFRKVISMLLAIAGKSLRNEIEEYFGHSKHTPSASAFVQQRQKISPNALPTLFRLFVMQNKSVQLYKGLRLIAVDGSHFRIPLNPSDADSFFPSSTGDYNIMHLDAMYDLLGQTYLDACLKGQRTADERSALCTMVNRANGPKALILADRGYEGFNVMAHIQNKGWNYLIRIQDPSTKGGIAAALDLPQEEEFDVYIDLSLTKCQSKKAKQMAKDRNKFRVLTPGRKHDYLTESSTKNGDPVFYNLPFRVVRFKLTDDSYEVVVTNLDAKEFPPEELKRLYNMRWGIETSFRELKYTVGLTLFHAKKVEYIYQEVFARLITYNFTQLIVAPATILDPNKKYAYKPNFAVAVNVCRQFILGNVSPPQVEATILRNVSPIRPGRTFQRDLTDRKPVSFNYRVA